MNWNDIKNKVYYRDGSWRDIYILGSSRSDWSKWVDYVNNNYAIKWFNGRLDKDEIKIDFNVIEEFWDGNHDYCSTATVFIDNIQVNAHFFDDSEIENDIDPRECNLIEDHNKIIKYMTDLSILLDKEVILTPENENKTVLIRVYKDDIKYSNDIDPKKWKFRI